jgi:predicted transposase YdaD
MKKDDSLWKAILEDVFDDFLRFFYPDAKELFDFKKGFEFLDKELQELFPVAALKPRNKYVDKLVKVFTRQGTEEWFLIHIEVQGYSDKQFAERMFQYYYRILDRYEKPVTAFAIFTNNNTTNPAVYERQFLGTSISYQYNICQLANLNEATLSASNNPFAMVVLTAKKTLENKSLPDEDLVSIKLSIVKALLEKKLARSKITAVMNFLNNYVQFANSKTYSIFEKQLELLTGKNTTMGIEQFLLERAKTEGKAEGIAEGRIEAEKDRNRIFVANLLSNSDFTVEKIASLAAVSVAFVNGVKKKMSKSSL